MFRPTYVEAKNSLPLGMLSSEVQSPEKRKDNSEKSQKYPRCLMYRGRFYGSKFSKIGIQPSFMAVLYSSMVRRVQLTPFTPQRFRTR